VYYGRGKSAPWPKCRTDVWCGQVVSPPNRGRGLGMGLRPSLLPSLFFFNFRPRNGIFGAFSALYFTIQVSALRRIILITSSVSVLQKALEICQYELDNLAMSINAKKTCCLRIGPRANARCASIVTLNEALLQWSNELRYHGVHVVRCSRSKISLGCGLGTPFAVRKRRRPGFSPSLPAPVGFSPSEPDLRSPRRPSLV